MSRLHIPYLNFVHAVCATIPEVGDAPTPVPPRVGVDLLTGCVLEARVALEACGEVFSRA